MGVEVVNGKQFAALLASGQPIVVDFFAEWCGPCKVIAPKFAELAGQHPNIKFVKIDVDQEEELAAEIGVQAMPSFAGFRGGQKVIMQAGASEAIIKDVISKVA